MAAITSTARWWQRSRGFSTWPGRLPRFRLHQPGEDHEQLLRGLPSMADVEHFAKRWRRRVPCPDPWAPVEGLYILGLYSRAKQRVYLGRYEFRCLVEHVLWTANVRPQEAGEEALPAHQLLLAAYALAHCKQKETFQQLVPALRSSLQQGQLEPQELAKLAWMFSVATLPNDPLLPTVGGTALQTPGIRPQHLSQIALALAASEQEEAMSKLEAVLERLLTEENIQELKPMDLQALASGLLRAPQRMARFLPHLLSPRMDRRGLVILYRAFQQHRGALSAEDLAAIEAKNRELMADMEEMLVKAAAPEPTPWAVAAPSEYQQLLQEPNITEVDHECTVALLNRLGITTDWQQQAPAWELQARSLLQRLRSVPFLEAHPVPKREQTFGYAWWSLQGADAQTSGELLLRSGHHSRAAVNQGGGDERSSVAPLVPLTLSSFCRSADCEIQALAAALREAKQLGGRILGELRILVDQTPCFSCLGAMAQFRALLPEVRVACHFVRLSELRRAEGAEEEHAVRVTYSVYEGHEAAATESAGGPSLEGAVAVLRQMLRAAGPEQEAELLQLMGRDIEEHTGETGFLPLQVMLPSPGAFHGMIRLALKDGKVREALALLRFMRRKHVRVFARTLHDLVGDAEVPPREAIGFLRETMEAIGLPASKRLLGQLTLRCGRLSPGFLRWRARSPPVLAEDRAKVSTSGPAFQFLGTCSAGPTPARWGWPSARHPRTCCRAGAARWGSGLRAAARIQPCPSGFYSRPLEWMRPLPQAVNFKKKCFGPWSRRASWSGCSPSGRSRKCRRPR
ncbi:unnamed protein product [Effrenium voratum]|uniref:Uncharacterized protein n=1 Tax=Effrenium voratum TaxID=2562239 RepID=A0AA36NBD4_9DINO|nr:unnamed protein product [Effrenium voratum]